MLKNKSVIKNRLYTPFLFIFLLTLSPFSFFYHAIILPLFGVSYYTTYAYLNFTVCSNNLEVIKQINNEVNN